MNTVQARRGDLWIGGGLLVFCGLAAWRSLRIKSQISSTIAGPSFLPWIMIAALTLLAISLILRALRQGLRQRSDLRIEMPDRGTLLRMAAFAILLACYAAAFMPVGYIPSTLAVSFIGLILLGERRPLPLILFPVVMTGLVYLGFTNLLGVWLP